MLHCLTLILWLLPHVHAESAQPCHQLMDACEKAGYRKGGHQGTSAMGLIPDCVYPLLEGKNVLDVNVAPAVIAACKERRDDPKHREKWDSVLKQRREARAAKPAGAGGAEKASEPAAKTEAKADLKTDPQAAAKKEADASVFAEPTSLKASDLSTERASEKAAEKRKP